MELTPREAKMLASMRKQQAQWPKVRWLQLIVGVASAAAFLYLFSRLAEFLNEEPMFGIAVFGFLSPIMFLWIITSTYKATQALVE